MERLAEAGFVYYLLAFYFVTLVVETVLLVGVAKQRTDREVNGVEHGQRKRTASRCSNAVQPTRPRTGAAPAVRCGSPRGEHATHDPLAAETLMHHVKDADHFLVPRMFSPQTDGKIYIPQLRESKDAIVEIKTGFAPIDNLIEPLNLQITKFMVLEVVGALILVALFIPLARRLKSGRPAAGRLTNLLEAMVLFIRDQVARPTIGSHDGDRFAPFLLSIFFFVLVCNLLGLVPWAGSPRARWPRRRRWP